MSFVLKAKKLASMSPEEWRHRRQALRDISHERKNFKADISKVLEPDFNFFTTEFDTIFQQLQKGDMRGLLENPAAMRDLPLACDRQKAQYFRSHYPQEFARSVERAAQFRAGKFQFMGIECHFPQNIPWQADPVSGEPYPDGFYRDLKIFQNRPGQDIKHVWEINRLQWLIEIAKAAYLTGEEKYTETLESHIRDWFAKNPYKSGVNWTSALEVGVRAISLIWVLNFYLACGLAKAEIVFIILKILFLSGQYIKDNLSIYFSPYNHLIGEVAALFMIGYQFPLLNGADDWQAEAWQILDDQVEKQFRADGGNVEQATFYHHFTLGFYLQCINARRCNGDPVSQRIMNQCERSIEFALQMTRPDGTLPWIGDIDSARSLYFSEPAHWDFRGFQGIGAVWFERSDMKAVAGQLREEAFWPLPLHEIEKFQNLPQRSPQQKFYTLGSSGYTVMRSGWQEDSHFSYIDCGPIADGLCKNGAPSAAHGHADLLHFEISAFGENLLIDPGFSNYRGDLDWHRYFRSTAAHNTLTVDGNSQLQQVGILSWSHAPDFAPLQRFAGDFCQAFAGEHSGFLRLPAKAVHRRYFLFIDSLFWLTFDIVYRQTAAAKQQPSLIEAHFHTNHLAEIQADSKMPGAFLIQGERASLRALFATRDNIMLDCHRCRGGENPADGWISPTYRMRETAAVVRVSAETHLPFELIGIYLPAKSGAADAIKSRKLANGFSVKNGACCYKIEFTRATAASNGNAAWHGVKISKDSPEKQQAIFLQSPAGGTSNGVLQRAPIFRT